MYKKELSLHTDRAATWLLLVSSLRLKFTIILANSTWCICFKIFIKTSLLKVDFCLYSERLELETTQAGLCTGNTEGGLLYQGAGRWKMKRSLVGNKGNLAFYRAWRERGHVRNIWWGSSYEVGLNRHSWPKFSDCPVQMYRCSDTDEVSCSALPLLHNILSHLSRDDLTHFMVSYCSSIITHLLGFVAYGIQ